MIRSLIAVLLVASVLTACGDDRNSDDTTPVTVPTSSIDREGTADEVVAQLEQAGFTVDRACVVSVLDEFTDDQLQGIDARLARGETTDEKDAVVSALQLCSKRTVGS